MQRRQVQRRVAATRADFRSAINDNTWDIVLSDHSMRGLSPAEALRPDSESARDETPSTTRVDTILVAEDEHGVRAFLETALTRAGHRVIATPTGTAAVEAGTAMREPLDLLIADVVMPGLSGPEVADRLKDQHPRMRSLFLSGYSSHVALPEYVTADPGAFLQKPFTVETLLARVRERLAAR